MGAGRFDFITDFGALMPMRVIGMLLGIPEEDQEAIRERVDAALRTEAGKPMDVSQASYAGRGFEEYIDWRAKHPSDDLMTELLKAEFLDETGTKRKLTREEVLFFVNVLAGAGNETTTRLIGWTGKVLSDHPEQRADLAAQSRTDSERHRGTPALRTAGSFGREICDSEISRCMARRCPQAVRC